MGSLMAVVAGLAATIPVRVLTSLGVGVLSFTAFTAITDQLVSQLQTTWSGLGADILSLLTIANIDDGIGIVLGAIAVRVTFLAMPKLGMLQGGAA